MCLYSFDIFVKALFYHSEVNRLDVYIVVCLVVGGKFCEKIAMNFLSIFFFINL